MERELWDLYTVNRERTGEVIARGDAIPEGRFRLVVHVCIFDSRGRMLIQQRQKTKAGWPDMWDVSVGGHVQAGETTQQAGERETLEELGLSIRLQGQRPAISTSFCNGYDDIYTIEMEADPDSLQLEKDEVQAVRWATMEEIFELMEQGRFILYHKSLIELEFYLRNHPEARREEVRSLL